MFIVIGADHGGFKLKEELKKHLVESGHIVKDYGTYSTDPVDYPDIALLVAQAVSNGSCDRGIMIDGTGIASSIVANKLKNVRATACHDAFTANSAREHNDSNMLCLGGSLLAPPLAKQIVDIWLKTPYAGGRHQKRIDKIKEIEKLYLK
ncbi:MAG TPA: ribose 5-phosphate isomerase B [bacterium]|nr:ribose 5-phosphate isomerase B [bacterium]HOL48855.1 ribose 5-phosphate isomerase B [bacterium]HPQ19682.1 ribose 5-phosphate isomerase B [bacterium]